MANREQEIKKLMVQELAAGHNLSEVQKIINDNFNLKMTFMEVRILASELENIDWGKDDEVKAPKKADKKENDVSAPAAGDGTTKIEVSKIIRPGAMTEGNVVFKSGASADWILDNSGRLGLDKVVGQPTQEDIEDFQVELQKVFAK